jgi:hypothetical protein
MGKGQKDSAIDDRSDPEDSQRCHRWDRCVQYFWNVHLPDDPFTIATDLVLRRPELDEMGYLYDQRKRLGYSTFRARASGFNELDRAVLDLDVRAVIDGDEIPGTVDQLWTVVGPIQEMVTRSLRLSGPEWLSPSEDILYRDGR